MDLHGLKNSSSAGLAGAGLGSFLGDYNNPADSALSYMDKIPDYLKQYLTPYIDTGNQALDFLKPQYQNLISNPGGKINEIGASYKSSPGFNFSLQQALQAAQNAAAAGGMAGSPQHEQQAMEIATGYANQDYNNYLSKALDAYGMGIKGNENLYNFGANTGMQMGEDLSYFLAQKAKLAYEGQNAQNQHDTGSLGSLLGGVAGSLPFLF